MALFPTIIDEEEEAAESPAREAARKKAEEEAAAKKKAEEDALDARIDTRARNIAKTVIDEEIEPPPAPEVKK